MSKNWTDKLPGLMEGFTEAEPEGLWDAVRSGAMPQKKRKAVPVIWWWSIAATTLAAAAVIAMVILRPSSTSAPEIPAPVPGNPAIIADADDPSTGVDDTEEDVSLLPQAAQAHNMIAVNDVREEAFPEDTVPEEVSFGEEEPDESIPVEVVPEEVVPDEIVFEETVPEETVPEENVPEEVVPVPEEDTPPEIPQIGTDPVITPPVTEPVKPRRIIKPRVQVLLAIATAPGGGVHTSVSGVGIPASPGIATKATGTGASISMLGRNKTSTTHAFHRQASRAGIGLKVDLDSHWGVETGIVSSSLESWFSTTSGNISSETRRTMDYIGIPLYGCFTVFEWRKLGFSLNAGPMYEFSVGTNSFTGDYVSNHLTDRNSDDTTVEDSKWSMNAGAAFQYRMRKHSALFVQPGVSYHFKNKAAVETIYTEQPASFNLSFGYKFQF